MAKITKQIVVELLRIYNALADQLTISADLAGLLHGIKDIRAGGNEIEIAVRDTLSELLPKRYHVGQGHIIDRKLSVSKQYDLVISENVEYGSIIKTKDQTELFFYETVFAIGEVKATWDINSLKSTKESIEHLRQNLDRAQIDSRAILSGSSEIRLPSAITQNPYRNPLFNFSLSIKADRLQRLKEIISDRENWKYIPNVMVVLNAGVFVLVKISDLNKGELNIHLYPEFQSGNMDYEWRFISSTDPGRNLAYLLFCLQEHLSNTIIEKPPFLSYSSSIIDVEDEELLSLDDI